VAIEISPAYAAAALESLSILGLNPRLAHGYVHLRAVRAPPISAQPVGVSLNNLNIGNSLSSYPS
jgi:hypothetical protein